MPRERVLITVKTCPTRSRKYGETVCTAGVREASLEKVRTKYLYEFGQRDLHLFLGTTQQFHNVAPNPWVIVGVFALPFEHQLDLGIEA